MTRRLICVHAGERVRSAWCGSIDFIAAVTLANVDSTEFWLGAATPDTRWLPVDMKQGRCRGKCASKPPPKLDASKRTKLGVYHK